MKIRLAKLSDYEELMNLYNIFVEEDRFSKKKAIHLKKS